MKYDEKQIEDLVKDLGVFELRAIARQMGVPSPTTKKRDELVLLIKESVRKRGAIELDQKRGRPYKKLFTLDDLTNKLSFDSKPFKPEYNTILAFEQEEKPIQTTEEESFLMEGIIRKTNSAIGFLDLQSGDLVFLSNLLYDYNELSTGDKIKVEAKRVAEANYYSSSKIIEINNTKIENYKFNIKEDGEDIIDNRCIPFAKNKNIMVGRRNVYLLEEDIFENTYFQNLYEYCNKNGFEFITIGANISFENKILFNNLKINNNFTSVYGTDTEQANNKVIDGINYAVRQRELRKEIVVFVTDVVEVLRNFDKSFEIEFGEQHSQKSIMIFQKLLGFAKSNRNHSSGTLIMGYCEGDKDDTFLTNDIFKISKKI